jgi:hypothetical protein
MAIEATSLYFTFPEVALPIYEAPKVANDNEQTWRLFPFPKAGTPPADRSRPRRPFQSEPHWFCRRLSVRSFRQCALVDSSDSGPLW